LSNKKVLIVIGGPTAVGKSALAIKLAKYFQCPILSADSRQFYKEMNIGTAKPTQEELAKATHYFIDFLSIDQEYTVGDFERDALKTLKIVYQDHNVAILVGGSGLYLKAVCEGLDAFPEVRQEVKDQVNQLFDTKGIEGLQKQLKQRDPLYYEKVDLQNPHRLMRALSVCMESGKPFSSFLNQPKTPRFFHSIYLWLDMGREQLYNRINQRVDQMINQGLEAEARRLYPQKELNALQTVGYQELFEHFDGHISFIDAIELIKRNTRRYAKRQFTWFRNQTNWPSFSPEEADEILQYIQSEIELNR
jgi:tRNA dimethylallyltransferase